MDEADGDGFISLTEFAALVEDDLQLPDPSILSSCFCAMRGYHHLSHTIAKIQILHFCCLFFQVRWRPASSCGIWGSTSLAGMNYVLEPTLCANPISLTTAMSR